eukprot:COSAG01_NODE_2342_length_7868_cov_104.618484_3_plen_74_part_00
MAAIEINPDVRQVIERIIVDLEATEDHSQDTDGDASAHANQLKSRACPAEATVIARLSSIVLEGMMRTLVQLV